MPQKRKKIVLFSVLSIVCMMGVMALNLVFMRPSAVLAEGSMDINGNGVLVRYNIKDGAKTVSIPTTVKAIGDRAFMGDKTLEQVMIPGNVKVIGSKAFYGCDKLSVLYLQEGTEEIKDSAFAMCTGLSRAQLPSSLRTLGNGVFAGDSCLNNIGIGGNRNFFLNDNVIYNRDSTKIIEMIPGRQADTYVMPFSVKSIAPYAFWGAENLKKVRVSNNVKSITPFAFTNASGLEFIYLPNSVNSIEEYAFRDCKNLKYVATETNIGYIADSAFAGTKTVSESNISLENALKKYTETLEKGDADKSNASSGRNRKDKDNEDKDKSGGEVSNGGEVIFNTPWGIRAPYKEIDTSDPDLYGTGKIVGGRTVIIPRNKQDYSGLSKNSLER